MMMVYEVQLIPAGFPKQGKQRQRVVKRLEKDQADFKCLGFVFFFPPNILAPRAILIRGSVIIQKPFPACTHAHAHTLLLSVNFVMLLKG